MPLAGRAPTAAHPRRVRVRSRRGRIVSGVVAGVALAGAAVGLYSYAQSPHVNMWVTNDRGRDSQLVDVRFDDGTLGRSAKRADFGIIRKSTGKRMHLESADGLCGPSGRDRATLIVDHPDQSIFGSCTMTVSIPSKDRGRPFQATVQFSIDGHQYPVKNSAITIGVRTPRTLG